MTHWCFRRRRFAFASAFVRSHFPAGDVRRRSAGSFTKITSYVNYRIHSATLLVYGLVMIRKVGEALNVSEAATSGQRILSRQRGIKPHAPAPAPSLRSKRRLAASRLDHASVPRIRSASRDAIAARQFRQFRPVTGLGCHRACLCRESRHREGTLSPARRPQLRPI